MLLFPLNPTKLDFAESSSTSLIKAGKLSGIGEGTKNSKTKREDKRVSLHGVTFTFERQITTNTIIEETSKNSKGQAQTYRTIIKTEYIFKRSYFKAQNVGVLSNLFHFCRN